MKRPISHILPLWISMLKLLIKKAPNKSLPSMKQISRNDYSHLLRRAIRSCRWAASKNKLLSLNLVSGCGGRPYMTQSFRVYHVVPVSAAVDDREPFNIFLGCPEEEEEEYYTAPSKDTSPAPNFFDCAAVPLCTPKKSTGGGGGGGGGFDAMAKYSRDPCSDFVCSMTEMIEAYSLTESQDLEALLHCYLRLNAPIHHPTITLAFLTALDGVGDGPWEGIPLVRATGGSPDQGPFPPVVIEWEDQH